MSHDQARWVANLKIFVLRRYPKRSYHQAAAVLQTEDETGIGETNTRRCSNQFVQHRRQLGTGLTNNFKHLGGRRLLFQRFGKLLGEHRNCGFGIRAARRAPGR